jgi:DNA primase
VKHRLVYNFYKILLYLKKLGYEDGFLAQTGLVNIDEKLGGRDRFRDRVMFPIMDSNHRVIGFGGRVMGNAGADVAKYLNSPETKIFEKSRNLYGLNFAKTSRKSYFSLITFTNISYHLSYSSFSLPSDCITV